MQRRGCEGGRSEKRREGARRVKAAHFNKELSKITRTTRRVKQIR